MVGKKCSFRVSIFPGKFPGKRDLDGKFPVSREAEKSGKLQTLPSYAIGSICPTVPLVNLLHKLLKSLEEIFLKCDFVAAGVVL